MLPTSRDDLDNNLNPLKNIGKSIVYYLINQILLQENFFFNIVTAHTSLIIKSIKKHKKGNKLEILL